MLNIGTSIYCRKLICNSIFSYLPCKGLDRTEDLKCSGGKMHRCRQNDFGRRDAIASAMICVADWLDESIREYKG
jgi:hypothetical protein